ncbi:putative glycosyltransferase [Desulfitobacterium dichloroeliminans LMG P-21439]|uniref:Putative glycosyltransferase n=1 Tax=Desulfitobacterium dichloroeliminans (strain LMG P-21439 / DCA1) TaxID=871963 RepID=L0F715_DESDL|nr:glycosyltransferase family 2 protein [Desulfitobacterium dichloroeliminans]AGA68977.1 putative glycosyltransferase [Desulfitobacterium dichloroeliminans LMG P-21439]
MDLSIVIVNWNSAELLLKCLISMEKWLDDLTYEVFVVDNCSNETDIAMLRNEIQPRFPRVNISYNTTNIGFGRANNQILHCCSGKYTLFLNPDTCFISTGMRELLTTFEEDGIGLVSCKLLKGDHTVQLSCFHFPHLWRIVANSLLLSKLLPVTRRRMFSYGIADQTKSLRPDWVLGAFMVLPTTVIRRVGGFDPAIFMYGEDMELCYQVRKIGLEVCYVPDFAVIHYGGCSWRKAWSEARKEAKVHKAILYFYHKHRSRGLGAAVRVVFALGALIRIIIYAFRSIIPRDLKQSSKEIKTQWLILLAQFRSEF